MLRVPADHFSSYSHLLGVLLSIIGLAALVVLSWSDPWRVVGFSIYGASLILLYSASTAYHWLSPPSRRKDLLRRLDHAAIVVLIAGTYTPLCLITLRGAWGWSVGGVVWGLAVAGVALHLSFPRLSRWLGTSFYLGMGWIAVVAVVPLVRRLPIDGLMWLLAGGVAYTLGGIVYATRRAEPMSCALRLSRDIPSLRSRRQRGPLCADGRIRPPLTYLTATFLYLLYLFYSITITFTIYAVFAF